MKYLGVQIDNKLRFNEHVKYLNSEVKKVMAKVAIVFRNTFRYANAARKIMVKKCIEALYLYASTVWYTVLQYRGIVNSIRAARRKANVLCARA